MTRTFRPHNKRRVSMFIWATAFLLIAAAQLISRHPPLIAIAFFIIACMGCRVAWRRVAVPLCAVTDDDIRISGVLMGDKRLRWRDIKEAREEENWLRLIGREWMENAQINLNHLQPTERQEFVQLVQQRVREVDA